MFHRIFHKKLLFFLFGLLAFLSPIFVQAETTDKQIEVVIFSSPSCPHCSAANSFINELIQADDFDLVLINHSIGDNISLAEDFYHSYDVPQGQQGLVPIIYIADRYFLGFNQDIALEILSYLVSLDGDTDLVLETTIKDEKTIKLPLIGEINIKNFSLPALAIILGTIDGFNVCSLGALILILGLVITLKSRRRIFILGSAFLLTTGLVYAVMIFLWHQLFTLLAPHLRSLELVVGILSILGGIYLLREFYKAYKSGPICSSNNILSRLAPKVEKIFQKKSNWLVLIGVIVLFSGAVTIIEFPCSAVLPVLFSGILVEAGTSQALVLTYIALFILFYLLDELIIFIIAVMTMKIKIVSPKFIVFFNLLAAFIFLGLGIFYLLGMSL